MDGARTGICPMHGCAVLHTHSHSNLHCSHTSHSFSLRPSPPEFRADENISRSLQFFAPSQQDHVLLTCTAPCGSPPIALRFPALPCLARFRAPVARAAGPPTPSRPDETKCSIAMAWYPRACSPPAAHSAAFRRLAGLGRAREYSRVGALVGHAGIWEICMGVHKAGVGRRLHDGARGKKERVSPHPCLARFRLGGVGGGRSRFPHPLIPTWVLYAYRFLAFLLHLSTR